MVARNGYAVEFRHILRGVFKDVGDDFHRRQGRVDVGVAHHKLLEDVVLDGALQLLLLDALFLGSDDVEGQNGQHGAVHSHRHAHLVERNLVEEDLHIEDAVDSHTSLADVAHNALVVRVVAAMCCQVESHRKTLLTGGNVAAVEGVRLFGGRESCVLAHRPGAHHIHRAVGSAQERRDTGSIVQMLHSGQVFFAVNRLYVNLFGSGPVFLDMVLLLPLLETFLRIVAGLEINI